MLTRVLISLPLVKVFHFCLCFGFYFILTFQLYAALYLHVDENLDIPGGVQCLCSLSADVPKWGLYGVAEQKGAWRTVLYNGFRFWDIVTGLP